MAAAQERYSGKVTPVGNSKGIRLDAAFFKAHPEFDGEVQATILAEGQVLLSAKATRKVRAKKAEPLDPVILPRVSRGTDAGASRSDPAARRATTR